MTNENPAYTSVYLLELELENIRCFKEKVKIDFSDKNGGWKRWNIVLGDNGLGKTTLLQCIDFISSIYFDKVKRKLVPLPPIFPHLESYEAIAKMKLREVDLDFYQNEILLHSLFSEKTVEIKSNFLGIDKNNRE